MPEEQSFNKAAYKDALIVPIVFGRNRLRGSATGAMVEDDASVDGTSHVHALRQQLAANAPSRELAGDSAFINKCVHDVLRIFAEAHAQYTRSRDGEAGFVYEARFPDGRTMLLAEAPTLRRLGVLS